jgi:hypothetical protein
MLNLQMCFHFRLPPPAWAVGRPLNYIHGVQCTLHAADEEY